MRPCAGVGATWRDITVSQAQAGAPGGALRDSDSDSEAGVSEYSDADQAWVEEHVSAEDEAALQQFLNPAVAGAQPRTLSDIILAKIQDRQAAGGAEPALRCAPAGLHTCCGVRAWSEDACVLDAATVCVALCSTGQQGCRARAEEPASPAAWMCAARGEGGNSLRQTRAAGRARGPCRTAWTPRWSRCTRPWASC